MFIAVFDGEGSRDEHREVLADLEMVAQRLPASCEAWRPVFVAKQYLERGGLVTPEIRTLRARHAEFIAELNTE